MRFFYESALGWRTLTSKNADCSLAQKPRARISSRVSGALLAPLGSTSPVTSWRTGSTSTSVHTTCRIAASRSRISLCRCMIYQYNTIQYNTYLIDRSPFGLFRANETQRNDGTEQQQLLRIPTGRRQTSWLFTSAAEKLNQGLPGSNSTSGQSVS